MADELRTDRAGLAAPVSGTLFEGRAARAHAPNDALQYPTGPEHRDMSELARIAAQLPGKPLTLDHPNGLIRDGVPAMIVGHVVSARVDGDTVVATFMVSDQRALDAIKNGTHELSMGYQCKLDEARYQRETLLDHLAIVPRARCGATCSLRADAEEGSSCACRAARNALEGDQIAVPETVLAPTHQDHPDGVGVADGHETCKCKKHAVSSGNMSDADKTKLDEATAALDAARNEIAGLKSQIDAKGVELATAQAEIANLKAAQTGGQLDAVTSAIARADKAEVEATNAKADLAAEKARADKAEGELAAAKAQAKTDADDAFNTRVDARVELLASAKSVGVENAKTMTDRDIKVAVIKHVDGIDVAPEKSMDFVDGVFAGALDRHAKSAGSLLETRTTLVQMRQDGAALPQTSLDAERAARVASENRIATAWITPSDKRN